MFPKSQIPPPLFSFSFPLSAPPPLSFLFPPWSGYFAFSAPALWPRMKAVQTQPVSSGVPREHCPTFLLLCFLSLSPSLCLSPIYLQLDVCSIDCFTEDMSGICRCPTRLYIDTSVLKHVLIITHRHTNILSQLVMSQCPGVEPPECKHNIYTRFTHAKIIKSWWLLVKTAVGRQCVSYFITTDILRERKEREKKWQKREGEKGVRKTEDQWFFSQWSDCSSGVGWEKKRDWKRGRGRSRLTECVCEGWEGVGGQSTVLLFTFLLTLTGCSAVAVCVCQIKQVKCEWGTLTGVKTSLLTVGSGHTHTLKRCNV